MDNQELTLNLQTPGQVVKDTTKALKKGAKKAAENLKVEATKSMNKLMVIASKVAKTAASSRDIAIIPTATAVMGLGIAVRTVGDTIITGGASIGALAANEKYSQDCKNVIAAKKRQYFGKDNVIVATKKLAATAIKKIKAIGK